MKTKLLVFAFLFSLIAEAQITKSEVFTTGTKLSFYTNQCGNTLPEATGKLTFCDRANNLGVVERSYGLNDRRVTRMLPNHFNEDEYYVTSNGLSIRNTDNTWENIPNIAIPLWGNTYLPTINTGLVLPDGKVIIQATNGGYLLNVYDRNSKTLTPIDFPDNKYPYQVVYDQDSNLTWVFASKGNTTYLFSYNYNTGTLAEISSVGNISISNSISVVYKNNHIYLGNNKGLYKIDISDYINSVPVTHYDSTTTPSLPFDRVSDLQFDTINDLWLANSESYNGGIVKFTIASETYDLYQTPRPDNAASNIRFNKLALDETGLIWAVGQNYGGLVKLTINNTTPNWTLLPMTDLTTLGVPITYVPNNIYFRNDKFYFTTTDGSSGNNNNFEVIINDNDVWSGRNDNAVGNLSTRMNKRFTNSLPDDNGGVWWLNRYDDIALYRDSDDNHQSILLNNLQNAGAVDTDNNAIIRGGSPNELRKIDFPNANSIQNGLNEGNDIKRFKDQIWVFGRGEKKIDVFKDGVIVKTYNLDDDWYGSAFYFDVDDDGDAWFVRNVGGVFDVKKFDTTILVSSTYDVSSIGSLGNLRMVVPAPDGGIWFLGYSGAVYQEAGIFYDFKTADYPEISNLADLVVDTNGKAYLLNTNGSITTIDNPKDANPILSNTVLANTVNSILPSLDLNGTSTLTIDSEGSVWTHGTQNAIKLIDDDIATEYRTQSSSLSIKDTEIDTGISIFPNPVTENIHINFEQNGEYAFAIYDITGKKLYHQKEMNQKNSLTLTNYASGIYFLKIKEIGTNKIKNVKIIKQ